MGQYDIDKDVYKNWLEEKTISIEGMTTREQIEERINEIAKIEFFAKREWAMLHQQYDKITGRKGIAPWLKEERDKLVTDPNIKVDWEGEPRKKEKKPKENLLQSLLGINLADLTKELKGKPVEKAEKKISMTDAISQMIAAPITKTEVKPTMSPEEAKAKADALKEKMRLAREAAANKQ